MVCSLRTWKEIAEPVCASTGVKRPFSLIDQIQFIPVQGMHIIKYVLNNKVIDILFSYAFFHQDRATELVLGYF